eukprot:s262_g22.t1
MGVINAIPYGLGFLTIFFGMQAIAGDKSNPALVRFNMRQAIQLDVMLFVPVVAGVIWDALQSYWEVELSGISAVCASAVFLTMLTFIVYSVGMTLLGQYPKGIPFASETAEMGLNDTRPGSPDSETGDSKKDGAHRFLGSSASGFNLGSQNRRKMPCSLGRVPSHRTGFENNFKELDPYLFTFTGHDAIDHLFEVSSGLDSLVLGEAQILAQEPVPGSGGKIIAKMLNAGIRIGKLVRTRTKIGKGSVSVSSAAVELMMSRSMQDLRKPAGKVHVCIVGAGKMSRLCLLALFSKHPDIKVTLVNRSVDKAQAVLDDDLVKARGGTNATVASMDDMFEVMKESDVVFTATGSEVPIIHAPDVEGPAKTMNLSLIT